MQEKKRLLLILFYVFIVMQSGICFATGTMSPPVNDIVTCGWGPRVHPVTGLPQGNHDGIDFGSDVGTAVHSVADGVVIYTGQVSGYGVYVEIDHGGGLHSFYAHLDSFASTAGQVVRAGDIIAYSGDTGIGTGPHLHFGMHTGCNDEILSGSTVNPAEFLDGNLSVPDSPMIGPDGEFYRGDDDVINISFDGYYDFAKPLREAINTFSIHCTAGIKLVQEEVRWLFFSLIVIDVALSAMFNLFKNDWKPIEWVIKRALKYGFILFLIAHWGDMIANNLKDYFVYMGATAVGSDYTNAG